jgi:hypothetical protein
MRKTMCMKCLTVASITLLAALPALGQQQARTVVNGDGRREVIDIATGWTETDKSGKSTNMPAADLTKLCKDLEEAPFLAEGAGNGGIKVACEIWGELQPRTQIERVPFPLLVTRLLLLTPDSTNFARYRGARLKSEGDTKTYDATIIPTGFGQDGTCTIEESDDHDEGMFYTYECVFKTASYPDAIQLKSAMLHALDAFHLAEDEVTEHGLAAFTRSRNLCAPNGECLYAHIYVSVYKDGKSLRLDATPDFTRNTIAEIMASKGSNHAPINGIASDSAKVSLQIISAGPPKADSNSLKR